MPAAEISIDSDPVGAGAEFAVAVHTSPIAPVRGAEPGPGASYAIVLDASQSMSWPAERSGGTSRWTLALNAIGELLRNLPDRDSIQVVAFSDRAWAIADTTTVAELRDSGRLERESAPQYGVTNIEAGLLLAYDRLGRSPAASRRAILFSDGEPNHGTTDPRALAAVAAKAAGRDVYTDAVGMGKDANFELLQAISALGSNGHVASRDGSEAVIKEIVGRLARQGQNIAAAGGELVVDVHPLFPITAVYRVNPARMRLGVPVTAGIDGAQRVTIPLGAVGTGDERPMYVLRLRAPDRRITRHLPIVKATGTVRTATGTLALDEANGAISGIAERPTVNLEQLMDQVRAIDLETETAEKIRHANPSVHADIYAEAKHRALQEGLGDLANDYDIALRGLQEGLDPNDVRNEQRSRSSTSRTSPNEMLRARPKLDPTVLGRRHSGRRTVQREEGARSASVRRPDGSETEDW
ncbi:VWA domain-containing protein [Actinomadura bangladeshensis]|uniref:VWA domain-containing protein n=1 Tax=Actinomadura bangladeshensis TaxID=453573 RepID=A0A4R4NUI7_9ACTN|nr:vWA domain-containing protein [Actinomadura bangladeshensis]TDC11743.1 VWA domain-containing protein [Actinomadura bangladeshensis]